MVLVTGRLPSTESLRAGIAPSRGRLSRVRGSRKPDELSVAHSTAPRRSSTGLPLGRAGGRGAGVRSWAVGRGESVWSDAVRDGSLRKAEGSRRKMRSERGPRGPRGCRAVTGGGLGVRLGARGASGCTVAVLRGGDGVPTAGAAAGAAPGQSEPLRRFCSLGTRQLSPTAFKPPRGSWA